MIKYSEHMYNSSAQRSMDLDIRHSIHPKNEADLHVLEIPGKESVPLSITMKSSVQSPDILYLLPNVSSMQNEEPTKSLHDKQGIFEQQSITTNLDKNRENDEWEDWEWNENSPLTKSSIDKAALSFVNKNVIDDTSNTFQIDHNDNFSLEKRFFTDEKNMEKQSDQGACYFPKETNTTYEVDAKQRSNFPDLDISNYFISSKAKSSTDSCTNENSFNSLVYVSQGKPVSKPSRQFASPASSPEAQLPIAKKMDTSVYYEPQSNMLPFVTSSQSILSSTTLMPTKTSDNLNQNPETSALINSRCCSTGSDAVNVEISTLAPTGDRNQYLLTSHLSDNSFCKNSPILEPDSLPPPGLSRLVLGQPEYNIQSSERMIPGTEYSRSINLERQIDGEDTEIGLTQSTQGVSFEACNQDIERPQTNSCGENNDVTTDRNFYLVPGESTDQSQRIITGLETVINDVNISPAQISTHVREIELDGENLEDQQLKREKIQSHSPIKIVKKEVLANELTIGIKDFSQNSTENDSESSRVYKKNRRWTGNDKKRKQHENRGIINRRNSEKFDISSQEESLFSDKACNWIEKTKAQHEKSCGKESHDKAFVREKDVKQRLSSRFNNISTSDFDCKTDREGRKKNNGDQGRNRIELHPDRDIHYGYQHFKKNSQHNDHYRETKKHRDFEKHHVKPSDSHRQSEKFSHGGYDDYRKNSSRTVREYNTEKEYNTDRKTPFFQSLYPFSSNYTYDHYAYYCEQIFRSNPQAYSDWYKRYYCFQGEEVANDGRQSVHSGRSSIDEDKNRSKNIGLEKKTNIHEYSTNHGRSTPLKFLEEHTIASFSSGAFILAKPNLSLNKSCNIIKLMSLNANDLNKKQFQLYPGPLIRGYTHKTTVIEFCEEQIKLGPTIYMDNIQQTSSLKNQPKKSSFTLLWRLMILLLRQNGMVVGTDIAELLTKNQSEYPYVSHTKTSDFCQFNSEIVSENNSLDIDSKTQNQQNNEQLKYLGNMTEFLDESKTTEVFRNYLLHGNLTEALRWATDNNLWGHALFLASKMDQRSHADVLLKFSNKLPLNDPLQTLYQLLSGRKPSSITSVYDENWGDWRPHLSMILSNSLQQPDLNRKYISTLGDTLFNRGDFYAAQFCYLIVQISFENCKAESSNTTLSQHPKMILLESKVGPFIKFVKSEAIMLIEIYEYACSLNDEKFSIPDFQPYKFVLATRMLDSGYHLRCLAYLEKISFQVIRDYVNYKISFIKGIYELAEMLKFFDPVFDERLHYQSNTSSNSNEEEGHEWLINLRALMLKIELQKTININAFNEEANDSKSESINYLNVPSNPIALSSSLQLPETQLKVPREHFFVKQTNLRFNVIEKDQNEIQLSEQSTKAPVNQENGFVTSTNQYPYTCNEDTTKPVLSNNFNLWRNEETSLENKSPMITLPNTSTKSYESSDFNSKDFSAKPSQAVLKKNEGRMNSMAGCENKTQGSKQNVSWFGGIFNKLSLLPKNQMILPDDKNPTIVWDATNNKWVNKDNDILELENVKPPPKSCENTLKPLKPELVCDSTKNTTQKIVTLQPEQNLAKIVETNEPSEECKKFDKEPATQTNVFKMQRGRSVKSSYVDVFNIPTNSISKAYEHVLTPSFPPQTVPVSSFLVPSELSDKNCCRDIEELHQQNIPCFYNPQQFE